MSDRQTDRVILLSGQSRTELMETHGRETLQADFDAFDISEELGFLLEEPLVSFTVIFSNTTDSPLSKPHQHHSQCTFTHSHTHTHTHTHTQINHI